MEENPYTPPNSLLQDRAVRTSAEIPPAWTRARWFYLAAISVGVWLTYLTRKILASFAFLDWGSVALLAVLLVIEPIRRMYTLQTHQRPMWWVFLLYVGVALAGAAVFLLEDWRLAVIVVTTINVVYLLLFLALLIIESKHSVVLYWRGKNFLYVRTDGADSAHG